MLHAAVGRYAAAGACKAFAFRVANSSGVIVPVSSSRFADSISDVAEPVLATERMYLFVLSDASQHAQRCGRPCCVRERSDR